MNQKEIKKYKDSFGNDETKNVKRLKREMKKCAEVGDDYVSWTEEISKEENESLEKDGFIIEEVNSPMIKFRVWFDPDAYKEFQNKKE